MIYSLYIILYVRVGFRCISSGLRE
ncbi:hypothetical protein MED222_06180 [Vibrio sp. MED222]|nr:hypothetical protein MED222_06180 [Vibrio sp. MED222]